MLRELATAVDAGEIEAAGIAIVHHDGGVTTAFGETKRASTWALIGAVQHLSQRLLAKNG